MGHSATSSSPALVGLTVFTATYKGPDVVNPVCGTEQGSSFMNNAQLFQVHKSFPHCVVVGGSTEMFMEWPESLAYA